VNELHDRINKATEYVTSETAFQHLAGNWILSWCASCHCWCPYWILSS
jgi:hypothetical protein